MPLLDNSTKIQPLNDNDVGHGLQTNKIVHAISKKDLLRRLSNTMSSSSSIVQFLSQEVEEGERREINVYSKRNKKSFESLKSSKSLKSIQSRSASKLLIDDPVALHESQRSSISNSSPKRKQHRFSLQTNEIKHSRHQSKSIMKIAMQWLETTGKYFQQILTSRSKIEPKESIIDNGMKPSRLLRRQSSETLSNYSGSRQTLIFHHDRPKLIKSNSWDSTRSARRLSWSNFSTLKKGVIIISPDTLEYIHQLRTSIKDQLKKK